MDLFEKIKEVKTDNIDPFTIIEDWKKEQEEQKKHLYIFKVFAIAKELEDLSISGHMESSNIQSVTVRHSLNTKTDQSLIY